MPPLIPDFYPPELQEESFCLYFPLNLLACAHLLLQESWESTQGRQLISATPTFSFSLFFLFHLP